MTFVPSARHALSVLLVCGGAFVLAAGCGSGDDKKNARGEAGAGGDDTHSPGAGGGKDDAGGAPTDGGAPMATGGAAGDATNGGQAGSGEIEGGSGGVASAGAPGVAGAGGEGGTPSANVCTPAGSVTWLNFYSEPIYQGCRGAVVRVPFTAEGGAEELTCCATSTSKPAFDVTLTGGYVDGTGNLQFEVPGDAPFGTYGLDVSCLTNTEDPAFSIEINDADAPFVLSISAEIEPAAAMLMTGQHLSGVTQVGAFRLSDGAYYECLYAEEDQTDTSIECSFEDIPTSVDENDKYVIYVASEECGIARNAPEFRVVDLGT